MPFGEYVDLIQREPTDLRIFFFDPIKFAPKLLDDYIPPKSLMGGFLDKYPSMFFGGKGSVTFLHYDIDMPHIFHTHFNGRKHVLLLNTNGKPVCINFLMQPMHWKIMILPILILKNSQPWMVLKELNAFWNMEIPCLCLPAGGTG
jgi:hypothetical protein